MKKDFITLLKQLKPEDWSKKVNGKWTIRDVLAHMVAWERDDPKIIRQSWKTKQKPWFINAKTGDYDDFDKRAVEYYRRYKPQQLLEELIFHQKKLEEVIEEIGEDKLKKYPDIFNWLFNDSEDSHYNHYYQQIKDVLEGKKIMEDKDVNTDFARFGSFSSAETDILKPELEKIGIPVKVFYPGTSYGRESTAGAGWSAYTIMIPVKDFERAKNLCYKFNIQVRHKIPLPRLLYTKSNRYIAAVIVSLWLIIIVMGILGLIKSVSMAIILITAFFFTCIFFYINITRKIIRQK